MIDSKNPSVELQNMPSTSSSTNDNFKSISVNGVQQDMVMCTICSKLEFISHGLQKHRCTTIGELDVRTLAQTTSTRKPPNVPTNDNISDALTNESSNSSTCESFNDSQIHPQNKAIMKEQLAFSFTEMFPVDGFNDIGFKAMTKYLLNVGATCGNVDIKGVLCEQKKLEEERKFMVRLIKNSLKKVVAEEKLVFSCDLWKHPFHSKRCITLSCHYIDNEFAIQRNVLGTRIFDESEFDGSKLLDYVTDILGEYTTTPSKILSRATIVTSKTEDFVRSFTNHGRLNCTCTILNDVVNHSLSLPCFQTASVCKCIKIRLERQPPNETYKVAVANLQLDDWFSIWRLFEAYQQYLETTLQSKNIIPDYEILYKFLVEAQKASKLLSSNSEATISTVYLIKKRLIDVMRGYNTGSFRWPEQKDKLTSYAENTFEITDVHRITLFLDPRYKSLKFLTREEKGSLHAIIRGIIGEMYFPDQNLMSHLNLGSHVLRVDLMGMAEVDNYLNLANISPETNVLEFWKLRTDFPKLRALAKELLCIPAVSAPWECYFNKEKYNLSRRRLHLDVDEIDTTLLLNGNSLHGMFDEQLKSLFES